MTQKIIRVRENDPIRVDEHTETWCVDRIVGTETDYLGQRWLLVLLERDEEESAEKLKRHQDYLAVVDRIAWPDHNTGKRQE